MRHRRVAPAHALEGIARSLFAEAIFKVERRQIARQRIAQERHAARSLAGTRFDAANAGAAFRPQPRYGVSDGFDSRFSNHVAAKHLLVQHQRAGHDQVARTRR